MISTRQKIANGFARYMQKPLLALVRPQPLARLVYQTNAAVAYYRPRDLRSEARTLGGVPCFDIHQGQQSDETLVYLHGGAFVIGSELGYRHMLGALAKASGTRGLFVNYRLAPEHPFPAAPDDCLAVYKALLESGADPKSIVLAGDSAGGNLALSLILQLKTAGLPMPAGLGLLSPIADLRLTNPSFAANRRKDMLISAAWGKRGVRDYLQGQDPSEPLASPVLGDLTGCPPTMLHVNREEVLYDDSVVTAGKLRAAGTDVTLVEETGLPHVWHLNAGRTPEADASIKQMGTFLRGCLDSGSRQT